MTADVALAIRREALAAARGGAAVAVATLIRGGPTGVAGAKLLVRGDGTTLGTLGDDALDRVAAGEAAAALGRRPREAVRTVYLGSGAATLRRSEAEAGGGELMIEVYERTATLLVVGGGHIGLSLATIAAHIGFSVTVLDDRTDYANAERFPMAQRVICGDFAEELGRLAIDGSTYIVLVTRGHRQDETSLRCVAASAAAYVGMIGSKRRSAAVLEHLRQAGVPAEALARVRAPVGVDIGAETPEEIAVSIMAEIVAVRRRRQAGQPG